MTWIDWRVKSFAGDKESPKEWEEITNKLKTIFPKKYLEKIELTAFVVRGYRKARWLLKKDDKEYCSKEEALETAKKLTWLMLLSEGNNPIPEEIRNLLLCKNKDCALFIGHNGLCGQGINEVTNCPLCKQIISLNDFNKDGRKDPLAIQLGHFIPLSRQINGHNARNVVWIHRKCNEIQSEQTMDELIKSLMNIVKSHGYNILSNN